MRKLSKVTVAIGATAAVLGTAGVAYAYWTTTGAGSGSATSGTTAPGDAIELVQSTPITGLYPGGPAASIMVTAHNPAAFNQVVGEVTVAATYPAACPVANWTLVNAADAFGNVGAGLTSAPQSVGTIALNETGANQDLCKTVTPTFALSSVSGE